MAGASTQALVSRASDGAAGAKTRDPAQETTRGARHDIALRESCAGSRVSFRSRKSARCTRPGHEATAVATPRTLNPIHLSNSPSQRFARPLKSRARRRVSLFPFSPNGERSAEKAPTCRACEARPNHAVGGVGRPFAIGTLASRRSTVAISDPGPLFLASAATAAPAQCSESLAAGS